MGSTGIVSDGVDDETSLGFVGVMGEPAESSLGFTAESSLWFPVNGAERSCILAMVECAEKEKPMSFAAIELLCVLAMANRARVGGISEGLVQL